MCRITRRTLRRLYQIFYCLTGRPTEKVEKSSDEMLVASAAILDVLRNYLPPAVTKGLVLEVASGTGQHVSYFAPHYTHITWQPSDIDQSHLTSIAAYVEKNGHKNILQPIKLDITQPVEQWASENLKPESCDLIYNANMVHISPWETSLGLFKAAAYLLKPGGALFMYGPFKVNGQLTPDSNVRFDMSLRQRDPSWGIRDIADLEQLANENGMKLENKVDMPANNKCVIYRKAS